VVTLDLLDRARAGDGEAFRQLVAPHHDELLVHCYRMLGSLQDAEDALQEAMLSAWRGLPGFEGRASVRTWLYRVATNRCLDALRGARRTSVSQPMPDLQPPEPTRLGEVLWLEPYPDVLLDRLADRAPGPEARSVARESVSLAFITALQLLPSRQRAVLVLRDVLDFRAREVAEILDTSEEAVTSALKHARATLQRRGPAAQEAPPPPGSVVERELVDRLVQAFEDADVDLIVSLLTDDAWFTMPPLPLEYQGPELAGRFLRATAFRPGWAARLIPSRANGQPAFGFYVRGPRDEVFHAIGLLVLTLSGSRISAMTRFDAGVLARFGLPRTLTG
jgi:RNA polymerase sigma-70 factor (TIGR02960 family)